MIPAAESRMYLRSRMRKRQGFPDEVIEAIAEVQMAAERTNGYNLRKFLLIYPGSNHNAKSCFTKSLITSWLTKEWLSHSWQEISY